MGKMKRMYTSPVFFAGNGTITLTVSQAAAIGISDPAAWEAFAAEAADAGAFVDGFNINDSSTWAQFGFNPNDEDTWWNVIEGFADEP